MSFLDRIYTSVKRMVYETNLEPYASTEKGLMTKEPSNPDIKTWLYEGPLSLIENIENGTHNLAILMDENRIEPVGKIFGEIYRNEAISFCFSTPDGTYFITSKDSEFIESFYRTIVENIDRKHRKSGSMH